MGTGLKISNVSDQRVRNLSLSHSLAHLQMRTSASQHACTHTDALMYVWSSPAACEAGWTIKVMASHSLFRLNPINHDFHPLARTSHFFCPSHFNINAWQSHNLGWSVPLPDCTLVAEAVAMKLVKLSTTQTWFNLNLMTMTLSGHLLLLGYYTFP